MNDVESGAHKDHTEGPPAVWPAFLAGSRSSSWWPRRSFC